MQNTSKYNLFCLNINRGDNSYKDELSIKSTFAGLPVVSLYTGYTIATT